MSFACCPWRNPGTLGKGLLCTGMRKEMNGTGLLDGVVEAFT